MKKLMTVTSWPLLAAMALATPAMSQGQALPPVDDTATPRRTNDQAQANAPTKKSGMGTGTKVVLLAGAAALYYMYKHHKSSAAQG